MARFARKVERHRRAPVDLDLVELTALAVASLGFDEDQINLAETNGVHADVVTARVLELLELLNGGTDQECSATRAELQQRNGPDFLKRVAAMGEPAAEVVRIRYRTVTFLCPTLRRCATMRPGWSGTGRGSLGVCWRPFSRGMRRPSSCGRACARALSSSPANERNSLFGTTAKRSTLTSSSAQASRNLRSGERAAPSSVPRTPRRPRRCAWSIADKLSHARAEGCV